MTWLAMKNGGRAPARIPAPAAKAARCSFELELNWNRTGSRVMELESRMGK
jgi:hypothetical protein